MKIERTENRKDILSIIRHESIYPFISDDLSPLANEFEPFFDDAIHWLLIKVNDTTNAGLFMCHAMNGATTEIHTCILPMYRGSLSRQFTEAVLAWIFANTHYQKVITHVPSYHTKALRLATDSKMVVEGVHTKSYLKDGELHDLTLLGITKEGFLSCQQQQ